MNDTQETRVVNFQSVRQQWNRVTQRFDDPNLVYIGRFNLYYGIPASPFANPFRLNGGEPRGATLERFRAYMLAHPHLIERAKRELKGRTLVCWCVKPGEDDREHPICHGQILRELIES